MKKILFILLFFTLSLFSINAQGWRERIIPADELKGNKEYIAYSYSDSIGSFIYWSNKNGQYKLITYQGIFNYSKDRTPQGIICGLLFKVGLYNENDELIDKFDMWLDCFDDDGRVTEAFTRDQGGMFNPVGQGKKVKKIMKYLNEKTGYVRFYADLYGNNPDAFDFKVPCKNK